MKVLTLTQPWATLVAIGAKTVETRSWPTGHRGPLAIHAAASFPPRLPHIILSTPFMRDVLNTHFGHDRGWCADVYYAPKLLPRGMIVAVCRLVDCVPAHEMYPLVSTQETAFGDYSYGRFAWLLDEITLLTKPVPAKGSLGLWEIDDALLDEVAQP